MQPRAADLFSRLLSLPEPIAVTTHTIADVDGAASAVATHFFLVREGMEAVLYLPSLSSDAHRVLSALGIEYGVHSPRVASFAVLDTSSREMAEIPEDVHALFIDHHTGENTIEAGSCSELVAEVLLHKGYFEERVYTLLAAGIVTDTVGLTVADARSLRVLSDILERTGKTVEHVHTLLSRDMDVSERIARLKVMRRAEIHRYGDFLLVLSRVKSFESSAASALVSLGADVAIVAGQTRIIGRLSSSFVERTGITLADIFSRLPLLEWGGHPRAAGGRADDPERVLLAVPEVVEAMLAEKGHKYAHRVY